MKKIYSNINIIGAGLIGLSCAYSLSNLGFKVTILEKNQVNNNNKYTGKDSRTTAISEGTKKFLDSVGIWQDIRSYAQPIKKIKVIDRNISNKIDFDNNRRKSNLGYIVKNHELINILTSKLKKKKNINFYKGIKISDIYFKNESIITVTNKLNIESDLNIAADGKNSTIRNLFKTPMYKKNYNKDALVVCFTHSIDHNSTAFEFFYKNGPLAILPMQKTNDDFKSSIVWTNEKRYLKNLISLDEKKLAMLLNAETNLCIGEIKKIKSKQLFPLSAHINTKFHEKRTIYVGDSAHSFHPIAGQGWNLGMSDVANLFNLAKEYKSLGIDLGNNFFCKKYHDQNFYNAYRLYQITDKLDYISQIQNPIINLGRHAGIRLIEKNKTIKDLISDFAMGF